MYLFLFIKLCDFLPTGVTKIITECLIGPKHWLQDHWTACNHFTHKRDLIEQAMTCDLTLFALLGEPVEAGVAEHDVRQLFVGAQSAFTAIYAGHLGTWTEF